MYLALFAAWNAGLFGSNASPAGNSHVLVSWRQGASAFPLAMCARLCWCALAVGVALGSLHDNEPMQADEPPIVRGDAPRGLFTPRWEEVQQSSGVKK